MKTTLLLLGFFCSQISMAQITNISFDDWNGIEPTGWLTSLNFAPGSVTESDNVHSGTKSISLNLVEINGVNYGGAIYTDNSVNNGINVSAPRFLYGWYIFNQVGTDEATIEVAAYADGIVKGYGESHLAPSAVFKQFVLPVEYSLSLSSIDYTDFSFQVLPQNINNETHTGSFLILDELSIGYAFSGTNEAANKQTGLMQVYPTPAYDKLSVTYQIANAAKVQLQLFDALGRMVSVTVPAMLTDGNYKTEFDTSALPSGIYQIRLETNNNISSTISVMVIHN
jgi:hypothetical protein